MKYFNKIASVLVITGWAIYFATLWPILTTSDPQLRPIYTTTDKFYFTIFAVLMIVSIVLALYNWNKQKNIIGCILIILFAAQILLFLTSFFGPIFG